MRTVTLCLVLTACGGSKAPPPTATTETPRASELPPEAQGLAGRLAWEAAHRPAAALSADAVVAALDAGGVDLPRPRQVFAGIALARYCLAGTTAGGVAVAVCEYDDEAAAARGRAHSLSRYAALAPDREIYVRGATTLTLAAPGGALARDDGRRAAAIFAQL
jgi:hypothetical protein